eukprot:CAMPEP_0172536210 /NCGR_PEP_ID=MMETSP1067-20121228/8014_1 /TAXON_ID=265564 ORGANISM="Thalassiosira punctigera, Strain Tpunct2005C2" /NCGR_SAMPLE_ID=MMETSP1067 /ASSEMBLY_ACC=CAM_ASM_000444 /LENGTH=85 /DNA_ID=CAMNT_0013321239 /DNA_START=7 /DNA_END=260 /DNA_ORIENTATION=-
MNKNNVSSSSAETDAVAYSHFDCDIFSAAALNLNGDSFSDETGAAYSHFDPEISYDTVNDGDRERGGIVSSMMELATALPMALAG